VRAIVPAKHLHKDTRPASLKMIDQQAVTQERSERDKNPAASGQHPR